MTTIILGSLIFKLIWGRRKGSAEDLVIGDPTSCKWLIETLPHVHASYKDVLVRHGGEVVLLFVLRIGQGRQGGPSCSEENHCYYTSILQIQQ